MYKGPKAFQRHFAEWRHAHGMRLVILTSFLAFKTSVIYLSFAEWRHAHGLRLLKLTSFLATKVIFIFVIFYWGVFRRKISVGNTKPSVKFTRLVATTKSLKLTEKIGKFVFVGNFDIKTMLLIDSPRLLYQNNILLSEVVLYHNSLGLRF